PERDFVGVNLSIKTASLNGVGLLEVPVGWMPAVARSMPDESSFLLETEMRVELGRTQLPAGAWAAAEVGDAVVFEGVSAAKDDTPWSCEIGIGGHRASAQLSS